MKAICRVFPGKPNSVHLAELAETVGRARFPTAAAYWSKCSVGVDGTDKEINAAEYGAAPDGYDFLVIGHESFGQVEAVGPEGHRVQARRLTSWPPCAGRAPASTTRSAPQT